MSGRQRYVYDFRPVYDVPALLACFRFLTERRLRVHELRSEGINRPADREPVVYKKHENPEGRGGNPTAKPRVFFFLPERIVCASTKRTTRHGPIAKVTSRNDRLMDYGV